MMGDGRTGHIYNRRNIQHTFLTVAEKPEDFEAARVAQKLEDVGRFSEVVRFGKAGCRVFKSGVVRVRKLSEVSHGVRC